MHSQTLQDVVTNTRDFESAELKANHAQAVNLVMNELFDLDSKLKQLSDLIKDISPNNTKLNQNKLLISNIPPATITNDKLLAAIFPFKFKELLSMLLFSRAALKEKPITTIYTNAKVDGHFIKLILNSESVGSIITQQLMDQLDCQVNHAASARIITANRATKTPIGEIDDLSIEINGIIIPIKVLVMEVTQYQALVGNNWLSKTNTMLN
ncbi:hypothetical protein G9A89_023640 [Geosiphon pyriformis]|nr:hypothetical protein G9A89_023640 [Geosiphon pyriformis]